MKEEQEEREEIERKEREQWDTDPKVEQLEGIQASIVMASSLAKEAYRQVLSWPQVWPRRQKYHK